MRYLLCLLLLCGACGPRTQRGNGRKLIVFGVDGMDPGFLMRHWDALPNLRRLRDEGQFQPLGTTTPPQSPVAWSTFITGTPPAAHGIFDFVHRDPDTVEPFSSLSRNEEPRWKLSFGPYSLPLSKARVISLRAGEPFWSELTRRGVPATVLRIPANYPPDHFGTALSGMGVPDVEGTLGTFTFYTNDPQQQAGAVPGGRFVSAHVQNGRALLLLQGPPNPIRKDGADVFTQLELDVDDARPVATVTSGESSSVLQEGEWSRWIPVRFPILGRLSEVRGAIRIFAKQLRPYLQVYVSPVNIDPLDPALPISNPGGLSRKIALEIGRTSTLGIPEDTSALRQGALNMEQFLAQTGHVAEEEYRLLRYALQHFEGGMLFFYISTVDQNSHILWREHETELMKVYGAVDTEVAEIRATVPDASLIVMSDHGFAPFRRAVHLNSWLHHRGFLATETPPGADTTLRDADWSRTKAYAIGLNALYLNLRGREFKGIVTAQERNALLNELRTELLAWRDPETGNAIIASVTEVVPKPGTTRYAPDLIVGYSPGYRASWETGLGGIPALELEDNHDLWIGDHCMDAAAVPGVFLSNARVQSGDLKLENLGTLILNMFGIQPK